MRFKMRGSLVVSRIEHPSVVRVAEHLAERGVVVEWVAPEASGRVDPAAVAAAMDRAALRAPVRLVALQAVNHETGVIQPVAAVADLAHARGRASTSTRSRRWDGSIRRRGPAPIWWPWPPTRSVGRRASARW